MRMYVGDDATPGSLAALLDEAVAAVGILRDHDESAILEACLSLKGLADQVVVLVLGRHAFAALALDLRVEASRADAESHALAGAWEELPSVLGDQDAGLSNVLAAKPVTIGRSRNTHVCTYFRMKRGRLLAPKHACPLDARARGRPPQRRRDRPENVRGARRARSTRRRADRTRSGACSPGSRSRRHPARPRGSSAPCPAATAARPPGASGCKCRRSRNSARHRRFRG